MGIDGLTGLRSRIALQRVLAGLAPSASAASPTSLILLDLDHFKSINDEHGYQVGDDVLREFAGHLARWARGVEVIVRFGGEEFAVVARMPEDHAARIANHIRSEWAELDETIAYGVTVSCGIATASEPLRPDDLIARADMALYRAKASGRDRVMTSQDLEVDRSRAGEDVNLWDFETKVRVLTDRFAGRLARLGAKATTRLREEVDRDSLTGLFSRRYLDRRLARELEQTAAHHRALSVILIDLDDFRTVNRDYGHPGGDAVLRAVGDSIRGHIRSTDWAARYGGEELCVVMPDASLDVAHDIAERLRGAIESASARAYDGREIRVTASLGVAELQPAGGSHAPDPVALIQVQRRRARREGRRQEPGLSGPMILDRSSRRSKPEGWIDRALDLRGPWNGPLSPSTPPARGRPAIAFSRGVEPHLGFSWKPPSMKG